MNIEKQTVPYSTKPHHCMPNCQGPAMTGLGGQPGHLLKRHYQTLAARSTVIPGVIVC